MKYKRQHSLKSSVLTYRTSEKVGLGGRTNAIVDLRACDVWRPPIFEDQCLLQGNP